MHRRFWVDAMGLLLARVTWRPGSADPSECRAASRPLHLNPEIHLISRLIALIHGKEDSRAAGR